MSPKSGASSSCTAGAVPELSRLRCLNGFAKLAEGASVRENRRAVRGSNFARALPQCSCLFLPGEEPSGSHPAEALGQLLLFCRIRLRWKFRTGAGESTFDFTHGAGPDNPLAFKNTVLH